MTPNDTTTSPGAACTRQFAVNWNNHMNHVRKAFDNLLTNSELTDVVLYVEGKQIWAHKVLLSACSGYFSNLFREFPQDRPIIVLKGVDYNVLSDILKFIYNGEVSIDSETFETFLQTAEFLQISGLTGEGQNNPDEERHAEEQEKVQDLIEGVPEPKMMKRTTNRVQRSSNKRRGHYRKANSSSVVADSQELSPGLEISKIESINYSEEINIKVEEEEEEDVQYKSDSPTENPLKCPICFKVFSHPYSLHHHKPVHSGGTKCPICHAVLSRKYNLKMHMRSRHNVVNV